MDVTGGFVEVEGEGVLYRISGYDCLEPFLVTVISPDDHWLFVSTSGALTGGRVSPELALLPYETDDRLHRAGGLHGPRTILYVGAGSAAQRWEPFLGAAGPEVSRNLYQSLLGDRLVFEERHAGLGLTFRARWATSRRFGLVRSVTLEREPGRASTSIRLLDGLTDLQPALVDLRTRQSMSNLVDAYTRCERVGDLPLAICSLEARIVDKTEPAEALRANLLYTVGLEPSGVSLRDDAPAAFDRGALDERAVQTGRRPGFFVTSSFALDGASSRSWHLVGDVHRDQTQIAAVVEALASDPAGVRAALEADIEDGTARLRRICAQIDGLQLGRDRAQTSSHASSALFNAMRGGLPVDGHLVPAEDLEAFVRVRSSQAVSRCAGFFASLEDGPVDAVVARAAATKDPDLLRLTLEYMPLWFSRRHGDPSRPWNHFAIRVVAPDGSRHLDWQGNWRDIFQNWEALCESFPAFSLATVVAFVNASTADGGNPYRVTRDGVDWEIPEPDHPWSHIGYWGDHQVVYLMRLLELTRRAQPGRLEALLDHAIFTYADVPYRLASYEETLADPHHTITFDHDHQERIDARVALEGADGRLLHTAGGELTRVTLAEKLLLPALAKVSNLVVGGGVWMNTQRPEWNDANNALAGWGVSVVTAAYLRRYCDLVAELLGSRFGDGELRLSAEVAAWIDELRESLSAFRPSLTSPFSPADRLALLGQLGRAFGRYRESLYGSGLSPLVVRPVSAAVELLHLARDFLDRTLDSNRRSDGLFHAYNVMVHGAQGVTLRRLPLMLEGQVAALDSGALPAAGDADLVDALFDSRLYRPDQRSFMLYPPAERPAFLERNVIPPTAERIPLVAGLLAAADPRVVSRDASGTLRFQGDLANASDLDDRLDELATEPRWAAAVAADRAALLAAWEEVFEHQSFTGRSGTMHGYEGIGCVYWHQVSKLQLAVLEACERARAVGADALTERLARRYHGVRSGLGPAKTPLEQGAFPTVPHSHTPLDRGAQQPGMTGQAKEAVLVRWRELGVRVDDGLVRFDPRLLPASELLTAPGELRCIDLAGDERAVPVPAGGLAFTYCQQPIVYVTSGVSAAPGAAPVVRWAWRDGRRGDGWGALDREASAALLGRTGELEAVHVEIPSHRLWHD